MNSPTYYLEIASWLDGAYSEYQTYITEDNHPRIKLPEDAAQSGDYRTEKVRASGIDKCPVYAAGESLDLFKKHLSAYLKRLFIRGNSEADIFKEAITWFARNDQADVKVEQRVENWELSGTIDALLTYNNELLPIEIKRTDRETFGRQGIYKDQVWQLICYMYLIDADCGFLATLYESSHHIWTVLKVQGGWQVITDAGIPGKFEGMPIKDVDFDDGNFFSLQELRQRILERSKARQEIYENGIDNVRPPYKMPMKYQCASMWFDPKTYQRKTGDFAKGDTKPGVMGEFCPLFYHCWKKEINEAGYEGLPDTLKFTLSGDQEAISFVDVWPAEVL